MSTASRRPEPRRRPEPGRRAEPGRRRLGSRAGGLACLLALGTLAGCSGLPFTTEPAGVVLLSPQQGTPRWSDHDLPALREQVGEVCEECTVREVRSSGNQAADARRVLREGADVLVLAADDPTSAARVVRTAGEVPVVAVDRFAPEADYYVGPRPSELAGTLLDAATAEAPQGRILVLTGPEDAAGTAALREQRDQLGTQGRRVTLAPGVTSQEAGAVRQRVRRALDGQQPPPAAVVAPTAATTRGAVRALAAADPGPEERPAVVGRGTSLAAVRRVVLGDQAVAVHTQAHHQAAYAAALVARLLTEDEVTGTRRVAGVPALLTDTRAATLDSLTTTVVGDGTWTTEEICDADPVRQRCSRLGIR